MNKTLMKMMGFKMDLDLPFLNKFLFFLPLRRGLIAFGYLQLFAMLWVTGKAIAKYIEVSHLCEDDRLQMIQLIIFGTLTVIVYVLDIVMSGYLICAAQMKLPKLVDVVYMYLKFKVMLFADCWILSAVVMIFVDGHHWYHRNLDPWMNYCLMENLSFGALVLIANFYLFLLVKSLLLKFNNPIDFVTLYQRCYVYSALREQNLIGNDTEMIIKKTDPNHKETVWIVKEMDTTPKEEEPITIKTEQITKNAERIARKSEPSTRDTVRIINKAQPIARDTPPIATIMEPIAKNTEKIAKDTKPVAKKTVRVPKEKEPIAKKTESTAEKTESTAKKTESTAKKTESTAKKPESTAKKTESTAKKPEQTVRFADDNVNANMDDTKI